MAGRDVFIFFVGLFEGVPLSQVLAFLDAPGQCILGKC